MAGRKKKTRKKKVVTYCSFCGVECKGKFLILLTKTGIPKPFCDYCFNRLLQKPIADIRKKIRKSL